MKSIALIGCLLLSACGNWSNKDLEFLNAMPTKEQLKSKLPIGTSGALAGEGTRRDALAIGERSKLYTDAKGASDKFNKILSFVIDVLDLVRTIAPTTRADDSRTWGPWDDKDNPGFQVQVVISKVSETSFVYFFQHRPKGGAFFNTISGHFEATETLRKGSGGFIIHAADASKNLTSATAFAALEKIEMSYVTNRLPVTVLMRFTGKAGEPLQTLEYGYQENQDKSGGIGFKTVASDPDISELDTSAAWLASGAGYGVLNVLKGNYKGYFQFECWDAAFNTTYVKQTWVGGVELGEAKNCVLVDNFPKP